MSNETKYANLIVEDKLLHHYDLCLAERLVDYVDIMGDGDALSENAKLIADELVRRLKIEDQIHQTMRVIGENALD